jgi:hypothetical protein
MGIDLNTAGPQRDFAPIPAGIYPVIIQVKPGAAGPDGTLTRSKDGGCEMLVFDVVVDEGEHAKARIFERAVISGTTQGHVTAGEISFAKLRAMVESARGIRPDDQSPAAVAARSLNSFADLNGLRCIARVAIEPERKNERTGEVYQARNAVAEYITPDRIDWRQLTQYPQSPPPDGGAPATPPPGSNGPTPSAGAAALPSRPSWAT